MVGQEGKEPRIFDSKSMPGNSPKVQQQPNFSDCGIYLLQYVESFFKSPITDYGLPIRTLRNWFPEEEVRNKRAQIAELIRQLAASQNAGKEFRYPEIMFQIENEIDMDDEEDSNHATSKQVKITSANGGTTMVRLSGNGNSYNTSTVIPDPKYRLITKKGSQLRMTPITSLPHGVTVTPAGPTVKLAQPGVKIISSASLANNLQVVNRKLPLVSSSSEDNSALPPPGDSPPIQTSPDSTSQGNEQAEVMDMEIESVPGIEPTHGSLPTSDTLNVGIGHSSHGHGTTTTTTTSNTTHHNNTTNMIVDQPDSSILRDNNGGVGVGGRNQSMMMGGSMVHGGMSDNFTTAHAGPHAVATAATDNLKRRNDELIAASKRMRANESNNDGSGA